MPTIEADNTYYIDHSDNDQFTSFISFQPEALQFDDQIRGSGNVSYQISFSAIDVDGNPIVTGYDFIGPYRTYYRLRYGDICIQAGVITSLNTNLGDDFMSVSGKTWENFLERWQYPFDPRVDHVNDYVFTNSFLNDEITGSGGLTPPGFVYQGYQRDVIRILSDILSTTMNVPNRKIFDLSLLANLSGLKTNYQFSLGDTSYMNSLIDDLAGTGVGFDWWISWDQKVYWASPYRFGDPGNPTIAYTVDSTTPLENGALGFQNDGPVATHELGTGTGLASQTRLGYAVGYAPAQQEYTRLDTTNDYGDIRNQAQLINRTQKQFSLDLQPQHTIPLKLDPNQIPDFWSTFRKGRAIWIDADLVSHRIDSLQQIVSYSAQDEENTGNILVDFTLAERYALSFNAGSPEG